MKYAAMPKGKLSAAERALLAKLAAMPSDQIDTQDIPEAPAENWKLARRGVFFRPIKQSVTIRLDADVIDWFKSRGGRYQTAVNQVLRDYMLKRG